MWKPIQAVELLQLISSAEAEMEIEHPLSLFWERIKIEPQKWKLSPWGDEGGGFWVIALIGKQCVYFNDIEDGFNISQWSTLLSIDSYYCNQAELIICIRSLYQSFIGEIGFSP